MAFRLQDDQNTRPVQRGTFHFHSQKQHPIGGQVTMFAPCSLLSEAVRVRIPTPAPRYGEHTRQVLSDLLGFTEQEIDAMYAAKIVADGWSDKYIPAGDPWNNSLVNGDYDAMMERISKL